MATEQGTTTRVHPALVLILFIAVVHATFYAFAIPPWALEDEEQHVDYALTIRDEWRGPKIDEFLDQRIIDSAAETDRWQALGLSPPPSLDPAQMGLEGLSYEGFQPPLYYLVFGQILRVSGDDPLTAMYIGRGLSVLLFAGLVGTVWFLMRRLVKDSDIYLPAGAALLASAMPVLAAAGGRTNNDILAIFLVGLGLLAVLRLIDDPSPMNAVAVGAAGAAAALTKTSGLALFAPILIGLFILWRRREASRQIVIDSIGLASVGAVGAAVFTYARYGVWEGTSAIAAPMFRPFVPRGPVTFVRDLIESAWDPYFSFPRAMTGDILFVCFVVAGLAALLVTRRMDGRCWAMLSVAGPLIVVLWLGNRAGLLFGDTRPLLPAYAAFIVVAMAGWRNLLKGRLALIPGSVSVFVAVAYALGYVDRLNALQA